MKRLLYVLLWPYMTLHFYFTVGILRRNPDYDPTLLWWFHLRYPRETSQ